MSAEISKLVMIDLCSGEGGASEAAYRRGWTVRRFDNHPQFADVPETKIEDLTLDNDLAILIKGLIKKKTTWLHMSFPCNVYTRMTIGKYWKFGEPPNDAVYDSIGLVSAGLRVLSKLKPRYWTFENPVGMAKKKLLGAPNLVFPMGAFGHDAKKDTYIWGHLPQSFEVPKIVRWTKAGRGTSKGVQGIKGSAARAKLPYGWGNAVCEAIETELLGTPAQKSGHYQAHL